MELVDLRGMAHIVYGKSPVRLTLLCLQEKEEYIKTTKDEGNRRIDFRFAY